MNQERRRIALVNCPAWGAIPPLGIAALKSFMVSHGYVVKCFDFNLDFYNSSPQLIKRGFWAADCYNQWTLDYSQTDVRFNRGSHFNTTPLPLKQWAEDILSFKPDVVGFSTNLTNMTPGILLAKELKGLVPGVPMIFGGPNVAQDREGDILLKTGVADIVVAKEGEETLLEVMKALENQEDVSSIRGIGLLINGVPTWTPPRPQIADLDKLPFPDFNDFPLDKYPSPYDIPIMASRGCVYHCAFCYEHIFWKKFRSRSAENVVAEMVHRMNEHSLRLPANKNAKNGNAPPAFVFLFADSLVNGHFKALEEMCDIIIERGIKLSWTGQATLDKRMTWSFFQKLKRAGCTGLAFGLESGSEMVLDGMSKNHNKIKSASNILEYAYKAGMPSTVNVMVGFPTERFRDFLQTIAFLFKNRKWIYQVSNVTETQLALGTPLWINPEKWNVTVSQDGSWTSPNTGTEKDRKRRLKLLHWSMTLLGIPHQRIAEENVVYCD